MRAVDAPPPDAPPDEFDLLVMADNAAREGLSELRRRLGDFYVSRDLPDLAKECGTNLAASDLLKVVTELRMLRK